ncbi:long-chain-fatty-acid--CoA ligase ACSBG2-like [Ambystoma mexicanum]|uniref:long-chain-fatty-acid--CoA ligase ACSBG2-like n=1 Tax=Ambystoma mexicanum TaxID=8296 RepID=UPI0037E8A3D4
MGFVESGVHFDHCLTPFISLAEHKSSTVSEKKQDPIEVHLAAAESTWTTERDGAVQLRMDATGPGSEPPVTTLQMFQDNLERFGHLPAMAVKRDGQWKTTTFLQYHQQSRAAAKSFLELGLERYHSVGILGFNSPEWLISEIGAMMAGGFPVGMYFTSSADACLHVAQHCVANILMVEDHQQLEKILQIQDQLPRLKAIVQYRHELKEKRPNLYTWEEFMQIGSDVPDSKLDDIIASQKANQCCMLIYTSGTTGTPKGVMLSHDNITWNTKRFGEAFGMQAQEIGVSYLPLSHIAAQVLDIWAPICFGGTTYFANPDALKGSLVDTLKEVRPTRLFGVPRVWEKIQRTLEDSESTSSFIKKRLSTWVKGIGLAASLNLMNGTGSRPWGYSLAHYLLLRKLYARLGLDRCLWCQAGAAPITKDTLEYFLALSIPLLQSYGVSECTGPHTMSTLSEFRLTSCGKPLSGCKTKILMPDEMGNGEVCLWGRHVFMGYLNMVELTRDAFDKEGWLRSGDIGRLDRDGFLDITGRIKELIITAGGENIPPVPIEDALKEEVPIISNAVLIGDKRKFLSMLITLKCTVDPVTLEPKDELTPDAIQFCQRLGSRATRVSEVVRSKDPVIYKAIQEGLDRVNQRAVSRAQRVQKWTILEKDFSLESGELGPTMKLKRYAILSRHEKVIDEFYKL